MFYFRRFEAQTPELFEQWKDAIESAIEKAYGDDTVSIHS